MTLSPPPMWPSKRELGRMACTCGADGAPVKRRCSTVWTRCNARLNAIYEWRVAAGDPTVAQSAVAS